MRAILDSRQLLAVVMVARTCSFTLASKELFLTQGAVSHSIKAMENELDCALFERTARGVILTAAGRQFLPYAEKILGEMEAAREVLAINTPVSRPRFQMEMSVPAR